MSACIFIPGRRYVHTFPDNRLMPTPKVIRRMVARAVIARKFSRDGGKADTRGLLPRAARLDGSSPSPATKSKAPLM